MTIKASWVQGRRVGDRRGGGQAGAGGKSPQQATADAMVAALEKSLTKQVERGKLEQAEADAVLGRVSATSSLNDLADCDLVIGSVVEDLAVKKELFRELNHICKDDAIIATNTSTLPVIEMAMETHKPELVVGVHFFNPAPMMSLVEVVRSIATSDETVTAVKEFAEACGKSPVEVKDRAGFIVNALLFPYLNNAVRMLESGTASRDDIDTAMKGGCNFPMGPLALLDLIGLDTSLAILDALYEEFRDPNFSPAPRCAAWSPPASWAARAARASTTTARPEPGAPGPAPPPARPTTRPCGRVVRVPGRSGSASGPCPAAFVAPATRFAPPRRRARRSSGYPDHSASPPSPSHRRVIPTAHRPHARRLPPWAARSPPVHSRRPRKR
jgi:3-hydroxybutyryl-CoA dehydrogenase